MQKLSQESLLGVVFADSLKREELLLKKYDDYRSDIKNRELSEMLEEFADDSYDHIKMLKDKMIKLNIQG